MFLITLLLSTVVFIIADDAGSNEWREVNITQGLVRGYKDPDGGLYVFYGIPYATAPTGKYRYKEPLPGPVWSGTLKAVNKDISCPQSVNTVQGLSFKEKIIQQDCLVANIFIPDIEKTNLPVLVYVHGGAFAMGSGNFLTPKNMAKYKKFIVVTFNYRIGALGFLCLGTEDVPGNAGMKDQVALLRWVKANIANFGGKADDVTIAGYSAGAISVDLLMLSNMTKGLFTKVIPESGSNLGPFAIQSNPIKNAKEFAKLKGFADVDNIYALEGFYKNTPWEKLLEEFTLQANGALLFMPCVERSMKGETFLSEAPFNILKMGNYKKLPLLYGLADAEGQIFTQDFEDISKKMNQNFASILPIDLKFESEIERQLVAKSVKQFYFKDKEVNMDTLHSFIDYYTDTYFAISITRAIKLQVAAGNNQIYVYEYSYVDKEFPVPIPSDGENLGATHCAQTVALLDGFSFLTSDETNLPKKFLHMKSVMRDLWYNFIVNKKPVPPGSKYPSWPPVNANSSPHMSLNEKLVLRGPLLEERMSFWHTIYDKYYNIPSPPATPPPKHTEL